MDIPEVDDGSVARLVEATNCAPEQAHFFLEACGGNYDRALGMWREQMAVSAPRRSAPRGVPPRPRAPAGPAANRTPAPVPLQLATAVLGLPLVALQGGLRLVFRTLGFGLSAASALAQRVLPAPLAHRVRGAVRAITQGPADEDPGAAAAVFIQALTAANERHPRWQACSWTEAAARAQAEGKFLFVYLHSAHHQDTETFCRDTLAAPAFVDYINSTFVSWGGDLRSAEAFRLSSSLRAAAFPYCALLALAGTRTRLITSVEGAIGPEALAEVLQAALVEHGALLWQERAQREQRETDRRLRQEQDAEYERSLEADRERERRAQEERAAQEEAGRKAREAAAAAAAAAAAEEQRRAAAAAALERRRGEKRLSLPPEPEAAAEGIALIRVRLPSGANHQRRFLAGDALQSVYDWVESLESHDHLRFSLASTYPRRVYSGVDVLERSLHELDLAPQAVLLVQPEGDE